MFNEHSYLQKSETSFQNIPTGHWQCLEMWLLLFSAKMRFRPKRGIAFLPTIFFDSINSKTKKRVS